MTKFKEFEKVGNPNNFEVGAILLRPYTIKPAIEYTNACHSREGENPGFSLDAGSSPA
ncbi:MAG: hypothetical protein WAU91_15980 [Desulfatitalea sp.]